MLDITTLLPELKKLVTDLCEDLLARSTVDAEIDAGLREAFTQIEKGGRTADAFEVWRGDYLDQVAVAWVLACVFVRFMEDNRLIDECWLAGEGDRRKLAEDTHELYFRAHPHESDREYFEHIFREVGKIPPCRDLFAEGKTPLWAVGPSGDAAMKLLAFWREIEADTGNLQRSFEVEDGDPRFLGDLYQDLSERARKKYALLQTPIFVEEFILDRTLEPAIDEFGLDEVRLIDPTCGSGHFLLGAFSRLFNQWIKREDNEVIAAKKALDGIWGVDINPFAVAIARFRLIVAALRACGIKRLKDAPAWNIHLATGDSLLFGKKPSFASRREAIEQQLNLFDTPHIYATEEREELQSILGQGYHAVVGNPPYITVKDKAQNQAYRKIYSSCHREYSLGVPFTQRFWHLALQETEANDCCGFVGVITANSFMKRQFGKKLVESVMPNIDLTHVIDTSGAYIPGHGTPTVILFGRGRKPVCDTIRAVMGIMGEPATPEIPSQGLVWQSIVRHIDSANADDGFTSTSDVPRTTFGRHPWSLGGGGKMDLKENIESSCPDTLTTIGASVGLMVITGEDPCFLLEADVPGRIGIDDYVPLVLGDKIRDWSFSSNMTCVWPNESDGKPKDVEQLESHLNFCWRFRAILKARKAFGVPIEQRGIPWWSLREVYPQRLQSGFTIAFPLVATHNHFVLDRSQSVFKDSAPSIKLSADASETDYLGLLGILNNSVACFWMQQTLHNKGGPGGGSSKDEKWHDFYEFSGTAMKKFPVPNGRPVDIASDMDGLARQLMTVLPGAVIRNGIPTKVQIDNSEGEVDAIRCRMIAIQEELDWKCYQLYGILEEDVCCESDDVPPINAGERAFEIIMARRIKNGELRTKWFEWLHIDPVTECPEHWPESYRNLVKRRIEIIELNRAIRLIETPDCKRRWEAESWDCQLKEALTDWLLRRLECERYWPNPSQSEPRMQSVSQLSDKARADQEFLQVAAIFRGREDFHVSALVAELVEFESVPLLPVLIYKPAGLRKRQVWERTWQLQRKEDSGEDVGENDVPPKYTKGDFQSGDCWRLRGRLDVPKERWISFPHCETESDPSLVVGWAGWDHLQQATALVAYYDARKREGWDAKRLTPLLAGLDQLLPWIHQWHPEVDLEFGETAGQSYQTMLEADAHELGLTLEEIRAWEPPKKTKKAGRRKAKG